MNIAGGYEHHMPYRTEILCTFLLFLSSFLLSPHMQITRNLQCKGRKIYRKASNSCRWTKFCSIRELKDDKSVDACRSTTTAQTSIGELILRLFEFRWFKETVELFYVLYTIYTSSFGGRWVFFFCLFSSCFCFHRSSCFKCAEWQTKRLDTRPRPPSKHHTSCIATNSPTIWMALYKIK